MDASHPAVKIIIAEMEGLWEPGEVHELRVPHFQNKGTISGYFDDVEIFARAAATLDEQGAEGVYFTINPVHPSLLARAPNQLNVRARLATSDRDVLVRRWIPIDIDPIRPAGISSSLKEHTAALMTAQDIASYLIGDLGVRRENIIIASSGNGAHVLYRLTDTGTPNSALSALFCQVVLARLDRQFSTEMCRIDPTTFNAARIWKVYGTTARKGANTADRPWKPAERVGWDPGEVHVPVLEPPETEPTEEEGGA